MAARDELDARRQLQQAMDSGNSRMELEARRALSQITPEPRQEEAPGAAIGTLQQVGQGLTLGFSDEIIAGVLAPFAALETDQSISEAFTGIRDTMRGQQQAFMQENPGTAIAAQIGGGLLTGGVGAARAAGSAALRQLPRVARGFVGGAVPGAAAGVGFGDVQSGEEALKEGAAGAAFGGAAGVAIPAVGGALQRTVRKITNKPQIRVLDESGQITPEARAELERAAARSSGAEVDDAIRQSMVEEGVMTPAQAERFNLFKSRGVEPLRANVTQSTDDFAELQSAVKRSGPVSEAVAGQNEAVTNLAREGVEAIRPATTDLPTTNASIREVVEDTAFAVDDVVNTAYREAREQSQGAAIVRLDKLVKMLRENAGRQTLTGGLISSVRQDLKNRGLIEKGFNLTEERISVQDAEEIRQALNAQFDSVTPFGRSLLREFKGALDEDVIEAVGEDVFRDARAAKQEFHRIFERGSRSKFDRSRGGILEDILNNKIPENKILQRVTSGRDDDFAKLKAFLTEDAGEQGQQVWNNLRAQVLRGAIDDAVTTQAKADGGVAIFNANKFKNAINRIKQSKKFDMLFNEDEKALVNDILEINRLRTPISSVATGKGPSELAVSELRREVMRRVPFIGESAEALVNAVSTSREARRQLDPTRETRRFFRDR